MTSVVAQIRKKEEQKGPETTKETETKKKQIRSSLKIGAIRELHQYEYLKNVPLSKTCTTAKM